MAAPRSCRAALERSNTCTSHPRRWSAMAAAHPAMLFFLDNYLNRAEQLIYEGRVEEAMNIMRDLLFEEPGYAPLYNYLGWAYLHLYGL